MRSSACLVLRRRPFAQRRRHANILFMKTAVDAFHDVFGIQCHCVNYVTKCYLKARVFRELCGTGICLIKKIMHTEQLYLVMFNVHLVDVKTRVLIWFTAALHKYFIQINII